MDIPLGADLPEIVGYPSWLAGPLIIGPTIDRELDWSNRSCYK